MNKLQNILYIISFMTPVIASAIVMFKMCRDHDKSAKEHKDWLERMEDGKK